MKERVNSKTPHTLRVSFLVGDEYTLHGPIDEVIAKLADLKVQAEHENCTEVFVAIDADTEWEYGDSYAKVDVEVYGYRLETEEEIAERRAKWLKKSKAAKKSAASRKIKQDEEDRKLFEKLKKKFNDV